MLQREPLCPHRIGPVRRMLENHREDLLAFAGVLEERFSDVAERLGGLGVIGRAKRAGRQGDT